MKKAIIIALLTLSGFNMHAQLDGPRTYWALPKNLNILSVHAINAKVNASVNNLSFVNPSVTVDNNLYMLSYTRSQPPIWKNFLFHINSSCRKHYRGCQCSPSRSGCYFHYNISTRFWGYHLVKHHKFNRRKRAYD